MTQLSWTKKLTVDKRIVRLLSASTYENLPDAIKEMISNAYDADATEVRIVIDLEKDFISINDNGNGMTPSEFDYFLRIAGEKRQKDRTSSEFRRRQIGQFGIGFLSVFPFGDTIEVSSSAIRSDVFFKATIPAKSYINNEGSIDIDKIPIIGYEFRDPKFLNQHGSEIKIIGLTEMVRRYLQTSNENLRRKNSIKSWSSLQKLKWSLQEDLPINFSANSPYLPVLSESDIGSSGIRVWLNGEELFRNSPCSDILESDLWEDKEIKCRYVIGTNWRVITPDESQYYKIHLRNVGIGKRTSFSLGLLGKRYSRLGWLSGEIFILNGFDNILSIDRSRFIESEEFDVFSDFFRNRLAYFANKVEKISEAQRDIKRQLLESNIAEVGSKIEIINEKISLLEQNGFSVSREKEYKSPNIQEPVKIDVFNKTVKIIENHPDLDDKMIVGGQSIKILYGRWPLDGEAVIRREGNNNLVINQKYPLFSSKRYGEVFKRILLVSFLLSEKQITPSMFFQLLAKELTKEFQDIS